MKRFLLLVVPAAALGAVILFLSTRRESPDSAGHPLPPPRTVDARDVAAYTGMEAHVYRVRTARDVLPGSGLSAAMAPLLIDWSRSDPAPAGSLLVRNVNHGGNPVSGVTVLQAMWIRPRYLREAEFMLVPLGGPEAMSHGQLRFTFEEGGIELLARSADTVGEPEAVNDLVLSWEAWRPPGIDFDVMRGMKDAVFTLSLRAYSGTQRFLEDALGNRGWNVYTLDLPGGSDGARELLFTALVLGDGAARRAIGATLDRADSTWTHAGPDANETARAWRELRAEAKGSPEFDDPLLDMSERTGYQSLVRSCATVALYCVDVAVVRLLERDVPGEGKRPTRPPSLTGDPAWMADLSNAGPAGLLVRAPALIRFLLENPTVIPSEIPAALDEAGLLVREGGNPRRREYAISGLTPWGHRDRLLVK